MTTYAYKVVPAPKKGLRSKGVKGTEARFASALETVMNELGAQGWEYQRTDTLPCEERSGMMGHTTAFQNMLVFRREIATDTDTLAPRLLDDAPVALVAPAPLAALAKPDDTDLNAGDRPDDTTAQDESAPLADGEDAQDGEATTDDTARATAQ